MASGRSAFSRRPQLCPLSLGVTVQFAVSLVQIQNQCRSATNERKCFSQQIAENQSNEMVVWHALWFAVWQLNRGSLRPSSKINRNTTSALVLQKLVPIQALLPSNGVCASRLPPSELKLLKMPLPPPPAPAREQLQTSCEASAEL